jgi:hypothetical protein
LLATRRIAGKPAGQKAHFSMWPASIHLHSWQVL